MLSKNQIKLITSLQQKKYRNKYGLFLAEGVKVVEELLQSKFTVEHIFCTDDYDSTNLKNTTTKISKKELKKISTLKSPNKVLGLFKIPEISEVKQHGLIIALDSLNDPGNLGTIIRLCDWFGIKDLVCSEDTVDCFNPKVVQSSMGSLTRVNVNYTNLVEFLQSSELQVFGADMSGENVYKAELTNNAILVMGNEANGLSQPIEALLHRKVTIPRFGDSLQVESLNVATATAILLSEFKRN